MTSMLRGLALSSLLMLEGTPQTVPGEQAQKNGVRTCLTTLDGVAKFLFKETKHSSLATWNKVAADSRLFNSQVAVKYTDGHSVAVVNVAPTKAGKCDGSYTTIFVDDRSCPVVRETIFKDWKFADELAGLVVLKNKDGGVSKILLPSGSGCVAITTEVIYE